MRKRLVLVAIVCLVSVILTPGLAKSTTTQQFANEPLASDYPPPTTYNPQAQTPYRSASTQMAGTPTPTIVLDPGHGGTDPGASGNGLVEKDLTLSIALKEKYQIGLRYPANIIMTRTNDSYVSLADRCNIANSNAANIFVSTHTNAYTDPSANGVETYWQNPNTSQTLASDLLSKLVQSGFYSRGVKQNNYFVITDTNMPASLIELGFVTNSGDAAKLAQNSFQDTLASEVASGIHLYWWGF